MAQALVLAEPALVPALVVARRQPPHERRLGAEEYFPALSRKV